ncbi:MAG: guanylate kinase, partial [Lachnospiraceae bacterium]|nr:guanylate kinase [Lachnospiraceae bacterium]
MGKIFVIMGKSASGKDSVYRRLSTDASLGLATVVPYTTRPMRAGETEGVEYHFVTPVALEEMRAAGKVIECRVYQTVQGPWAYFTPDDGQIDPESGSCLLIGTLESYQRLRAYFGADTVVPVYLTVNDGERLLRSIGREMEQKAPNLKEVCRRFLADEEDFS